MSVRSCLMGNVCWVRCFLVKVSQGEINGCSNQGGKSFDNKCPVLPPVNWSISY